MSDYEVMKLPKEEMLKLNGADFRRFILVNSAADLERALPVLDRHISEIYQQVPFNVFEIDTGKNKGKFAIESADPNFYMGIGENSLLYSQVPPIPNGVLDLEKEGKLEAFNLNKYTLGSGLRERLADIFLGAKDGFLNLFR